MPEKQPFTPVDIAAITSVHAVQSFGDNLLINFTKRNLEANILEDHFSLLDHYGNTYLSHPGSSAQLSPDGQHIAFEYNSFLHIYHLPAKETSELVPLYSSAYFMGHMADQHFRWSPDSRSIAFISIDADNVNNNTSVVVVDRLLYKTKGGRGREKFAGNQPFHIYIVNIDNKSTERITDGPFNDHSITWSPDGNHIAFISNRTGDPDLTHRNDLYVVNIHTKKTSCILTGTGNRLKPSWSPAGNRIAFLADENAHTSKDSPAPDVHVFTINPEGNDLTCHTRILDRRTDNIKWNEKGDLLFFTAGDHGSTALFALQVNENKIETIIHETILIKDYSLTSDPDKLFIVKNTIEVPDELFVFLLSNNIQSVITNLNTVATDHFLFADAEMFWCNSADNTPVQGWLMKPSHFDAAKKYPCILVMHGGPHNMYGFEFDEKIQLLSAAGFGVLFANPRGSSGYGQDFTNGNLLNWGGKDFEDVMAALNFAVNNNYWIDTGKLGVTGQSYGGFLTNWIITQTPIFKAAVSDGGISNLISFAGTSLYHCLIEAEFNGNTWNNYELLWNWSPLKYAVNISTPTLFLHGETDNEVPVSQSEEIFSAMKRLGIETQMVRYQNEGHGWRPDLLPANRIDNYERMINWFNRFLI